MSLLDLLQKGRLERKHNVCKKVAIAAVAGATVGVIAGILLAPKTGKETRQDLVKNFHELPDKVRELSDKTQELVEAAKEIITEKTQKIVSEVKEKATDIENVIDEESRFKKLAEITEEQVDAFKKKLT